MNGNNQRSRSNKISSTKELPEKLKLSQARKFLGISFAKMTSLINSGTIEFEQDPLDHRVKLVKLADLEALKRQRSYV